MMNKLPPEVADLLMRKVMEKVKEGDVKAIAVKFGKGSGEMEDDDEEDYGEEEDTGEMCPKCGHDCPSKANYCPECGHKTGMKEEKMEEKQGDNGGSNEEEMTEEEKNITKLKEYSKKK